MDVVLNYKPLYLYRYVVFLSLLEYPRGVNITDIQDEMNSNLQELTQDVSYHWKKSKVKLTMPIHSIT